MYEMQRCHVTEQCGNRFAVASGLGSDQEDRITKSCVLGVDFGQRHTGLAISSTGGFAARPLKVLSRRLKPIDLLRMTADQVLGVALSEGADRIVVGMPVTLEGDINDNRTDSKHGRRCRNFAITLASKARPHGMKIFLCNEAGTTLGAVRSDSLGGLASSDLLSLEGADGEWLPRRLGAKNKKKAKKGCVDAKAAALLLQLYHRSPKTAIEVHPPEAS
ncbi:unnamed protein product [Ostreobium quekettii]|uniref:YqgF/RNase H-like domain-containing protein n=1 Tax=Ostreobium quekettii TaxID=121088 RepID=A0A8S1ITX8_9CHLO|nr:unnamed protein product [Ostreobium quekettii]|eukprot:evm.model.scf_417.6 EVM.evm.TU.scf_417.6   scf_417:72092-77506(-)